MQTTKPNIVFITAHDTGRHFGCYGIDTVSTPNIDQLAAEGALLENFYCTSPVCSPSRGAMMTGMYPQSNGLMGLVHPPSNWTFMPGVKHLSHLLTERGYRTALFFHQHEVMPDDIDSRLGFEDYLAHQNDDPAPLEVGRIFSEYVKDYNDDRPFYAQIGFGLTHRVWDAYDTPPDCDKGVTVPPYLVDNEAAREDLAALQGAVKHLDAAIGVILDGLARANLIDNTIVVVTVDHGIEVPRAKWYLYDAGIEVGFVMRGPGVGVTVGRRCNQLLSNVDVTPTLFELIGEEIPDYMQGKSFADVVRGVEDAPGRDAVFAMYVEGATPEARCVRTDHYKLIKNFSNHRLLKTPVDISDPVKAMHRTDAALDRSYCPTTQLYDLQADPLEYDNLSGDPQFAQVEKQLEEMLWQWMEQTGDPILAGPMRVPIYDDAMAGYERYLSAKHG